MNQTYLEVTYRSGRALAAYLYLPRRPNDRSSRSQRVGQGLVIDFARDGRPIGIEITAPQATTSVAVNKILREFGLETIRRADLAPLRAA